MKMPPKDPKSLFRLKFPGRKQPLCPAEYQDRITRIAEEFARRIRNSHPNGMLGDILKIVHNAGRPVTRREVEQELGIGNRLAVYGRLWLLERRGFVRVSGGTPSPRGPNGTLFEFQTDKSSYKVRKAQEWLEREISKAELEARSLATCVASSLNFAGSERNRQIVEMYSRGVRKSDLAARFGITQERVRQIVAAAINRKITSKVGSPGPSKRRYRRRLSATIRRESQV